MPDVPDPAAGDDEVQPGEPDENTDPQVARRSGDAADAEQEAARRDQEATREGQGTVSPADEWLTAAGVPRVHWLLVHGGGLAADDLVQALVGRLRTAEVHVTVRTIDDYLGTSHEAAGRRMDGLKGFTCVLLVLPSAAPPAGQKPPWKAFGEIATVYRQQTLCAAEAYRPGAALSQEAGVIQVFHREEDLDVPEVRALLDAACDTHCYSEQAPEAAAQEVFRIFPSSAAGRKVQQDEVIGAMRVHWRDVKKWGIDALDRALTIKRGFDRRRQELEDPGKRAMYRPIAGIAKNRLELLITEPETRPPVPADATNDEADEIAEKFRDSGARAVRDLINDMIEAHPWFHRPVGREKDRDAQKRFLALYRALQIVTSGSGS